MAEDKLPLIFLSASVPVPGRDSKYTETADLMAIRDAVKALTVCIHNKAKLVWGGHPAITPIIRITLEALRVSIPDHHLLYQSREFEAEFPPDNQAFNDIVLTEKQEDREVSLRHMRMEMLAGKPFSAAFFVGGMEGIEEEYELFRKLHPKTPTWPIASTGSAAKILFNGIWGRNKPGIGQLGLNEDDIEDLMWRLEFDQRYVGLINHLLTLSNITTE